MQNVSNPGSAFHVFSNVPQAATAELTLANTSINGLSLFTFKCKFTKLKDFAEFIVIYDAKNKDKINFGFGFEDKLVTSIGTECICCTNCTDESCEPEKGMKVRIEKTDEGITMSFNGKTPTLCENYVDSAVFFVAFLDANGFIRLTSECMDGICWKTDNTDTISKPARYQVSDKSGELFASTQGSSEAKKQHRLTMLKHALEQRNTALLSPGTTGEGDMTLDGDTVGGSYTNGPPRGNQAPTGPYAYQPRNQGNQAPTGPYAYQPRNQGNQAPTGQQPRNQGYRAPTGQQPGNRTQNGPPRARQEYSRAPVEQSRNQARPEYSRAPAEQSRNQARPEYSRAPAEQSRNQARPEYDQAPAERSRNQARPEYSQAPVERQQQYEPTFRNRVDTDMKRFEQGAARDLEAFGRGAKNVAERMSESTAELIHKAGESSSQHFEKDFSYNDRSGTAPSDEKLSTTWEELVNMLIPHELSAVAEFGNIDYTDAENSTTCKTFTTLGDACTIKLCPIGDGHLFVMQIINDSEKRLDLFDFNINQMVAVVAINGYNPETNIDLQSGGKHHDLIELQEHESMFAVDLTDADTSVRASDVHIQGNSEFSFIISNENNNTESFSFTGSDNRTHFIVPASSAMSFWH